MDRVQGLVSVALAAFLVGCGGGGGGGRNPSPGPTTPPPTPTPTAALTAQTGPMPLQLAWLDETALTVTGNVSWTNLPAGVYVVATDLGNYLGPTKALQVTTAGAFSLSMAGDPALAPGNYSGSVTVQACQDSACAKPFTNTAVTLPYSLVVSPVDEWSTYQRTPGHNAYVPITLNPSRFALKWKWNTTDSLGAPLFEQGPNLPAVTNGEAVFTVTDMYRQPAYVFAVEKSTGRPLWSRSVGMTWSINPPAVSDGIVYVATSGLFLDRATNTYVYDNSYLWAFNASDGSIVFKSPYPTSWASPHFFGAPTVADGVVYINGGEFALQGFAFDAKTGAQRWAKDVFNQPMGMTTPTVLNGRVFNAGTGGLFEMSRTDGSRVATVPNGFADFSTEAFGTAAVASSDGGIVALAGSAAPSGFPHQNSIGWGSKRAITRYTTNPLALSWASGALYDSTPVVANGVVYAYRQDPAQLDAVDEATGQVLWSWPLPVAEGIFFRDNMIVTRNILFFNTNTGFKAFDLKTRSIVWRLTLENCNGWDACYGNISMSADRILFLTRSWNILAISLR